MLKVQIATDPEREPERRCPTTGFAAPRHDPSSHPNLDSSLRVHSVEFFIFKPIKVLWLLVILHASWSSDLRACQICLPYPARSVADELIEAEHVVLCREDPYQPFTLKVIEVVKGGETDTPLNLFLDSSTRRLLANDPDRSIVCVSSPEPGSPPWKRVATLTPELEPILQYILDHSETWKTKPEQRPAYFSQFLDHSNPQLSSLAHLEVARAPYDTIKQLAGTLSAESIREFLGDFRMMEWHALYILLLAQSDEPQDQQRIRENAESHAKFSLNLQTAAWATAYIEIAKEEALEFFDQQYLRNPSRSPEEIDAILAAYSVHGSNGHTDLRPRIVESYRELAGSHPTTLATLASDLTKWNNNTLVPRISTLLTEHPESFDIEQTIALRNYLRHFETPAKASPATPPAPNRTLLYLLAGLLLLPIVIKFIGLRREPA